MTSALKQYFRVFTGDKRSYLVDQSVEDVNQELTKLIIHKGQIFGSANLTGTITNGKFYFSPTVTFIIINNGTRDPYYGKGEMIPLENGKTRLIIKYSVSYVFIVLHIAFLFVALFLFISFIAGVSRTEAILFDDSAENNKIILSALAFFCAGTGCWLESYYLQWYLRRAFEKAMELQPEND